jgi:ATP-binding cassette, subfamily B, bacterial HlyB/CyaB
MRVTHSQDRISDSVIRDPSLTGIEIGTQPTGHTRDRAQAWLHAVVMAARYYGMELTPGEFRNVELTEVPSAASLAVWAQNAGMWARAVRLRWRHLMRLRESGPVVLLFMDGSAGLLVGANSEHNVVLIRDPLSPEGDPVTVDEMRLAEVWSGETIMLRANRGVVEADEPFSLTWLAKLVLGERKSLRDIAFASFTLSCLTIFPPFLVMTVTDRILAHQSYSTLILLSVVLGIFVVYETVLGFARRLLILTIGTRIDTRLNLHVFNRLIRLSLDYFERHPAGETMHKVMQIHKVREFLTGKLLMTLLDLITLGVLLPFLFYLDATLAWIVVACACCITLIILASLRPLRAVYKRVVDAETNKHSAIGETIFGVKTVKALALEPARKALWDERVAEAGRWRLVFGKLSNWPQTLVTPFERFMWTGTIILGAYLALSDQSGYMVGSLFAFMMLSQRVAQPLVGLARLIEDYEEVGAAIGEAASVLNRPLDADSASGGLRPKFSGAITFEDVSFTYGGTKTPALDRVSFLRARRNDARDRRPLRLRQVDDRAAAARH